MKTFFSIALILSGFAMLAQVRTPSPSPAGSVSTVVGHFTDVKIDYSRPRIKGRKIFGRWCQSFVISLWLPLENRCQ